jgi:hypothetical protein
VASRVANSAPYQVIVAIRLAVLMAIRQVLSEAPFLSGAP